MLRQIHSHNITVCLNAEWDTPAHRLLALPASASFCLPTHAIGIHASRKVAPDSGLSIGFECWFPFWQPAMLTTVIIQQRSTFERSRAVSAQQSLNKSEGYCFKSVIHRKNSFDTLRDRMSSSECFERAIRRKGLGGMVATELFDKGRM